MSSGDNLKEYDIIFRAGRQKALEEVEKELKKIVMDTRTWEIVENHIQRLKQKKEMK